jgi:hypothetical protein
MVHCASLGGKSRMHKRRMHKNHRSLKVTASSIQKKNRCWRARRFVTDWGNIVWRAQLPLRGNMLDLRLTLVKKRLRILTIVQKKEEIYRCSKKRCVRSWTRTKTPQAGMSRYPTVASLLTGFIVVYSHMSSVDSKLFNYYKVLY